jgi:hypothetical protein
MPSDYDRPRLSRTRVLLMGIALLGAVTFGAPAVSRVLFASWSIGLGGRDTLTGIWVGPLHARQGAEYGLVLALDYKERGGPSYRTGGLTSSQNLQGRATLCTPTGERYAYQLNGKADPLGGIEALWLEDRDPELSAPTLRLSGAWRPPALTFTTDSNPFLPDGRFVPTRVLSGDDPDDTFAPFVLTKDDEKAFEAICRRIRR